MVVVEVGLLLVGFGYAAWADFREREVTDRLWQVLGVLGVALGAVVLASGGGLALGLWLLVGALGLEHMFPWDDLLHDESGRTADLAEGVVYAIVVLTVAIAAFEYGVGPAQVPVPVLALLATILFARGLFEAGVLYGGADAKALMIAGTLVPIYTMIVVPLPGSLTGVLNVLPFAFNVLLDAALLSLAIPIAIGLRNLARGEFRFPAGFTGYTMPVGELPDHYVWLENPMRSGNRASAQVETSEEDRKERARIARELSERGVERVWVTPQIPFLVLIAAGTVTALLAGNLILDLLAVL